ncbi:hypothetical protein OJ996_26210 [Luteolibacter sp. GHJ8]|uniref:Cytochrome c-type biogenesis protein CcmF C-terminal domain-containing protein n=1 Tax=Luteolibacter rhizosphaerae TaxID=2989719 RepID=A0ABT3GB86_9BACT|nr:hypothetical protein [Luteolibacter rhizosphaerae]MCW1917108.1 hypothetical protein [Luteolibacter rhizosphaerae]
MPLHRTLTFYLGLFPLVILLWIWADSARNSTTWFRCQQPEQAFLVGSAGSNLGIGTLDLRPDAGHRRILTLTPGYGRIERYPLPDHKRGVFPSPTGPSLAFEAFRDLTVNVRRIPFWILAAAYLPLWLGAAAWQARVIRRRIAAQG